MDKLIKINGTGSSMVTPDTIKIVLSKNDVCKEYDKALEQSTNITNEYKKILEKLGMEKFSLKTEHFSVDTKYETREILGKNKRKLVGYEYQLNMSIEFKKDNEILGKVLYELTQMSLSPEFSIEYTVKDYTEIKEKLLIKAINDAQNKAEILLKAANANLGKLMSIDYSWNELQVTSRPLNLHSMYSQSRSIEAAAIRSYDIDIEPSDIKVEDTVTVVWEINS